MRFSLPAYAIMIRFVSSLLIVFTVLTVYALPPVPLITVRFANPQYDAATSYYCADVEFISHPAGAEVFGINMRLFYDDALLEFVGFSDFQGGYAQVTPIPPYIVTSPAGPALFGFSGPATLVNGAMQLINVDTIHMLLDTVIWTSLYKVCFTIDDPNPDPESFCPSLVLDLEQNPANGGFLVGDNGIVITAVNPNPNFDSSPATENVEQFNWTYIGSGPAPWGQPIETSCIVLVPTLAMSSPASMYLDCTESTDPAQTGMPAASDQCDGEIVLTYNDAIESGTCAGSFVIVRTWTATNDCNESVEVSQEISISDIAPPVIVVPANSLLYKLVSSGSSRVGESQTATLDYLDALNAGSITAEDQCGQEVSISYNMDQQFAGDCAMDGYFDRRIYTWVVVDACGNASTVTFTLEVVDDLSPVLTGVPDDDIVLCEPLPPVPDVGATDLAQPVHIEYLETIVQGSEAGAFDVTRTWIATDGCGNSSIAVQQIIWIPESLMECSITVPQKVKCNSGGIPIDAGWIDGSNGITYAWKLDGAGAYIQMGQGTPHIRIHMGASGVMISLKMTDYNGCTSWCESFLDCNGPARPIRSAGSDEITDTETIPGYTLSDISIGGTQDSLAMLTGLNLWPNPASNLVSLSFQSGLERTVEYSFTNFLGQVLLRDILNVHRGQNSQMIDVSALPNGHYILVVKTAKEMYTRRIVILRNQ